MRRIGLLVVMAGLLTATVWAQEEYVPVSPEQAGLVPKTGTIDINAWASDADPPNNGSVESLGVGIGSGGNIIIGWEDDSGDQTMPSYLGAVWVIYKQDGTAISAYPRAYFSSSGEPTGPQYTCAPKIKANLYGAGFGLGSWVEMLLAEEIPELFDVNTIGGDPGVTEMFPVAQPFNEDGTPEGPALAGVSDAYAERSGGIRISDWDYLSNGNIVIGGESRQQADLVDVYGGAAAGNHSIFSIVRKDGTFVKSETLVDEAKVAGSQWHGIGSTQNGFAVRWDSGGPKVRMFDNQGNPTTGNIVMSTLTGDGGYGGGGRGDGAGFHGNGKDAYVIINTGSNDLYTNGTFLACLNADGTLKWKAVASDDVPYSSSDRVDAAINEAGYVFAVWSDMSQLSLGSNIVFGRVFNPDGTPKTGTFYISERATPENYVGEARRPRAAWRDDTIAVIWEDMNNPNFDVRIVALRVFNAPTGTGIENFMLY
ncbi:MAG TPA: hypothetical protein PK395_21940 [bacterium]|nr:hypothetical protein [bacterium]